MGNNRKKGVSPPIFTHQVISIDQNGMAASIKMSLMAMSKQEKDGQYVSFCPALDLYSDGDTAEKAIENIVEATALFIQVAFEKGTLKKVLDDCGFHHKQTSASLKGMFSGRGVDTKAVSVEIPLLACA